MRFIISGIVVAMVIGASPAAGETRQRASGELAGEISHEEGDYGTGQSIRVTTARSTLRVERDGLFLIASLPYLRLDAPGNVVGGGAGPLGLPIIVDPNQPATRDVREGLGDVRLGGGYRLSGPAGFDFALLGEVKLPTASEGLGTGETDLSVGVEAARTVGRLIPFVSLSYFMPGDPGDFALRNGFAASGGLGARLSDDVRGSIAYGYRQSASPLVPDEQQLSTGLEVGLSRRVSVGFEGSAGLSDGAADLGAGVRIGWRLF